MLGVVFKRWATNLGGTGTKNGRDSIGKRLGVKRGHGAKVKTYEIIVRQRGSKWLAGENVKYGRDWTIYALCNGKVKFTRDEERDKAIINVEADPIKRASISVGHLTNYGAVMFNPAYTKEKSN